MDNSKLNKTDARKTKKKKKKKKKNCNIDDLVSNDEVLQRSTNKLV